MAGGGVQPKITLTSLAGNLDAGVPMMSLLKAPTSWRRIEFISDLHLGPESPRTFDAWAAYMRSTHADAVLLLGDWMEVWVGDDSRHEGFEARCAAVLADTAKHRTVAFMAGNRDFLVGHELLEACGVLALPDPTILDAFGERVVLTHGDSLCLSDTDYQRFREHVRDPAFQRHFLGLPMATRREVARKVRNESEQRKGDRTTPVEWADVDPPAAVKWLEHAGAATMIHGHTHRPGSKELSPGRVRHVLSDWDLDHTPHRAEIFCWTSDGLSRQAPPPPEPR